MRIFTFIALIGLSCALALTAAARPFTVLVYNVENLHDADGQALFEEYQPAQYSPAHVLTKLQNIAAVVARFENGRGPDVILFQEIEVDQTPGAAAPDYEAILARYASTTIEEMLGAGFDPAVADLPAEALLAKAFADRGMTGYHVVAGESVRGGGDRPLVQKCVTFTRFPVQAVRSHPTVDARAVLEVDVEVEGALLYLFNNHWKSGAGDPKTEVTRIENARTLRHRLDEILKSDPNADVVIGGDFNSQHNQKQRYPKMEITAMNDVLGSQGNELAVRGAQRDLYNLWFEVPVDARGSDTYQGEWGTLIQMLVTRGLYDFRGVQYVDDSFGVGKFADMNVDAKGWPKRWSSDGPAGSGWSDHFPVYATFQTVADNRPDRYLSLRKPSVEPAAAEAARKIDYSKVDLVGTAVTAGQLPPGTSLRREEFKGKVVRVEGVVREGKRLSVEFLGDVYDVWSFDEGLRNQLRTDYAAGQPIRFYGELGQYKGRWQFVIPDQSWVK